jgi:hypothetical protein
MGWRVKPGLLCGIASEGDRAMASRFPSLELEIAWGGGSCRIVFRYRAT